MPFYKNVQSSLALSYEKKRLFLDDIVSLEKKIYEGDGSDNEFSVVLPTQEEGGDVQVVNRRKLLPDITIGLTKKEVAKLAKVLSESDIEVKFCIDLLADLDLVELEEKIGNNR